MGILTDWLHDSRHARPGTRPSAWAAARSSATIRGRAGGQPARGLRQRFAGGLVGNPRV